MQDPARLETALRNAHAAGDTAAARRIAQEIRRVSPSSARQAPQMSESRLASDTTGLFTNPVGYAVSRGSEAVNRLLGQRVSEVNPAQAMTEAAPAAQMLTQGAGFGAGDEFMGAAGGLAAAATGGDYSAGYRANTDAARESLARNREAAPVSSLALEAAGGAGLVLPGVSGFVGGATGRVGLAGRSALTGGGTGAVAGFMEDEGSVSDRLDGAAIGAAAGVALGGGAPLAIEGGSRLSRGMARAASRAWRNMRGGNELTRSQRRAWNRALAAAQEGGVSEQELLGRLNELDRAGMADEQTIAEVLGEGGVNRARGGVATGDEAALAGRRRMNERQSRQPERVRGYLQEGVGADGSEFDATRQRLNDPTPRENELYSQFRDQAGVAREQALQGFLENQRFARIARQAAQDISDETGQRVSLDEEFSPALVDAIKRRMDRLVSDAESGAARNTAASRPLRQLRDRWVAFADEAFPNYAPARAGAQIRLSAREALEEGRNIFRTENVRNPEQLARMVEGMTDQQRQAFRQGVARGVVDQMNAAPRNVVQAGGENIPTARDASNPISRFWNRADRQEALRAAFGNEDEFARFVRRMAVEGDRAEAFRLVSTRTQGSPTQGNQAAANLSSGLGDVAEAASGNTFGVIFRRAQQILNGRRGNWTPEVERELQEILWSTVPEQRTRLLQVLQSRNLISADQAASINLARTQSARLTNAAIQGREN